MSTNLPMRTLRASALERQCLFLRHQRIYDRPIACTNRTFSSTASKARAGSSLGQDKAQTKASARAQVGPSPKVNFEKAQREEGAMAEDIGLLQNTIIRAPLTKLPNLANRAFWSYFWKLFKSKGTALYSRSAYRRCREHHGWKRWLPEDLLNSGRLKDSAKKLYTEVYTAFAAGDMKVIEQHCLPPLIQQFKTRIAARAVKVTWKIENFKSVRIVSHRAAPLGEDYPDTAYRQVVFRLESTQVLTLQPGSASPAKILKVPSKQSSRLLWTPRDAQATRATDMLQRRSVDANAGYLDNGRPQTVVEYLVLQKRIIRGKEENWKIQGFTEESTPAALELDEGYWRRTLAIQTAGGER
ncbi:hypothetical protein ACN47E_000471 [Coniothyrium glycines]